MSTAYSPICESKTSFEEMAEKVKALCDDLDPNIATLAKAQYQFIEGYLALAVRHELI